MESSIVDRLHEEFKALTELLRQQGEPSLVVTADDTFRKVLILSAASLFEAQVLEAIQRFVGQACAGNTRVIEFVRRKALARQYHALFSWEDRQANAFFALFGEEFKAAMTSRFKTDEAFAKAVGAFLEVGRERNRLVHQNFGHISLEKTADEIFELYRAAAVFVAELPSLLVSGVNPPVAGKQVE